MSLIGANALPLLANIKAREDGNLTLPAFHAASESSLSKKKKSPSLTIAVVCWFLRRKVQSNASDFNSTWNKEQGQFWSVKTKDSCRRKDFVRRVNEQEYKLETKRMRPETCRRNVSVSLEGGNQQICFLLTQELHCKALWRIIISSQWFPMGWKITRGNAEEGNINENV